MQRHWQHYTRHRTKTNKAEEHTTPQKTKKEQHLDRTQNRGRTDVLPKGKYIVVPTSYKTPVTLRI